MEFNMGDLFQKLKTVSLVAGVALIVVACGEKKPEAAAVEAPAADAMAAAPATDTAATDAAATAAPAADAMAAAPAADAAAAPAEAPAAH